MEQGKQYVTSYGTQTYWRELLGETICALILDTREQDFEEKEEKF